ncbi:MAG: hypothetical protein WC383_14325 [Gammaproteobacteria bacterium]|jgi:hypothetical protein
MAKTKSTPNSIPKPHTQQPATINPLVLNGEPSGPTWAPVIFLDDGQVVRLPGGLSRAEVMAVAEQQAERLENVDRFGVRLERINERRMYIGWYFGDDDCNPTLTIKDQSGYRIIDLGKL